MTPTVLLLSRTPFVLLHALAPAGPITRDGAQQDAHREVSKEIYHADEPGLLAQVIDKVIGWLDDLLGKAAGAVPGGGLGLLAIVLVLAALVTLLLWRSGPLRRGGRRSATDEDFMSTLDASDHRRFAAEHAAAGRYAEAVRERMRAIVRELERRGVLEPRPGRTADEVAFDAGAQLPALATHLMRAARIFDEVWYGGRTATAESHAALEEVDRVVRDSPLTVTAGPVQPYLPGQGAR